MGADDGSSEIPLGGKPKPMGIGFLGHPVNPPTMVKWVNVRSKKLSEIKGVRCIYLKVIMIKNDTYHDTWTNYLMKQEPSVGSCCH
jgi:hypothetical protein